MSLTEMPQPAPHLERFFWNRLVLKNLTHSLGLPFATRLNDAVQRVAPYTDHNWKASFTRVRRLSPLGSYPNRDFRSGPARYVIQNSAPYVVTANSARQEEIWSYGPAMHDWTRHETRLTTAIGCAERGGWTLFLSRHCYDFTNDLLKHVDHEDRVPFAIELAMLKSAIAERQKDTSWKPFPDASDGYSYADYSPYEAAARAFGHSFLVSHPVLLRTGRCYAKSLMLWRADGFEEDAVVSLLFALEGCLLLLQETANERTDRIDRRALKRIFPSVYHRGEWLYEWIEEVLGWGGMRAQLVHPERALSDGWKAFITPGDFYDHARTVRALLTYVLTGATHEDYPLFGDPDVD